MKRPKKSDPKAVADASKVLEGLKPHIERVGGVPVIKAYLLGDSQSTKTVVRDSFGSIEREAFAALTYVRGAVKPDVDVVQDRFKLFSFVTSDKYLQELCKGEHNNQSAKATTLDVLEPLLQMNRSSIEKYSRPGKKKLTPSRE